MTKQEARIIRHMIQQGEVLATSPKEAIKIEDTLQEIMPHMFQRADVSRDFGSYAVKYRKIGR